MSSVRLLVFAGARDIIGDAEVEIPLEAPVTARGFLTALVERYPGLSPYTASLRLAVNGQYALWMS